MESVSLNARECTTLRLLASWACTRQLERGQICVMSALVCLHVARGHALTMFTRYGPGHARSAIARRVKEKERVRSQASHDSSAKPAGESWLARWHAQLRCCFASARGREERKLDERRRSYFVRARALSASSCQQASGRTRLASSSGLGRTALSLSLSFPLRV